MIGSNIMSIRIKQEALSDVGDPAEVRFQFFYIFVEIELLDG